MPAVSWNNVAFFMKLYIYFTCFKDSIGKNGREWEEDITHNTVCHYFTYLVYHSRPFFHDRLSTLLSLWLPAPKARWPRTTWTFSRISGRSRCASWPRPWMTSPPWMTSCPFQVWFSADLWMEYPHVPDFHLVALKVLFSDCSFKELFSVEVWCKRKEKKMKKITITNTMMITNKRKTK